jgi:hypothetical protein
MASKQNSKSNTRDLSAYVVRGKGRKPGRMDKTVERFSALTSAIGECKPGLSTVVLVDDVPGITNLTQLRTLVRSWAKDAGHKVSTPSLDGHDDRLGVIVTKLG